MLDGSSHGVDSASADTGWKWYEAKFGTKLTLLRDSRIPELVQRTGATVLLLVDAFDVVIDADAETILARFFEHFHPKNARIVFSAEAIFKSWPDASLTDQYPPVEGLKHFVNAGVLIGYAEDLLRLWEEFLPQVTADDDDQLFYARLFVQQEVRERYGMVLDHDSVLVQTYTIPCATFVPNADVLLSVRFEEDSGRAYVSASWIFP